MIRNVKISNLWIIEFLKNKYYIINCEWLINLLIKIFIVQPPNFEPWFEPPHPKKIKGKR